ncbi:hypothetical protein ATI53_1001192 [Salipiger aestuarii]|uniref:Uncharacterized protein n=1 Tax=Salipiger aestuarii TaxID=568098 RepID=A0A327YWL9_9RHOB|nr:hypothetical protein [Salipiger aestuarii]RAK24085.1 hypothetical protein ATI53_1001192 [Salipiger aestuarii]
MSWQVHAENLLGRVVDPLARLLEVSWSALVVLSMAILLYALCDLAVRIVLAYIRSAPSVFIKIKWMLIMSEFLSKGEALKVIEGSDFVQSRLPSSRKLRPSAFASVAASIQEMYGGRSQRDQMVERQFLRNVLAQFEAQRSNDCTEEGYRKQALDDWLEALFAYEVKDEMGDIPNV